MCAKLQKQTHTRAPTEMLSAHILNWISLSRGERRWWVRNERWLELKSQVQPFHLLRRCWNWRRRDENSCGRVVTHLININCDNCTLTRWEVGSFGKSALFSNCRLPPAPSTGDQSTCFRDRHRRPHYIVSRVSLSILSTLFSPLTSLADVWKLVSERESSRVRSNWYWKTLSTRVDIGRSWSSRLERENRSRKK